MKDDIFIVVKNFRRKYMKKPKPRRKIVMPPMIIKTRNMEHREKKLQKVPKHVQMMDEESLLELPFQKCEYEPNSESSEEVAILSMEQIESRTQKSWVDDLQEFDSAERYGLLL